MIPQNAHNALKMVHYEPGVPELFSTSTRDVGEELDMVEEEEEEIDEDEESHDEEDTQYMENCFLALVDILAKKVFNFFSKLIVK